MAGTVTGGQRAAATNRKRYGDDFYKTIASMGGRTPTNKPKGFAADPERARRAGQIGGRLSKRKPIDRAKA